MLPTILRPPQRPTDRLAVLMASYSPKDAGLHPAPIAAGCLPRLVLPTVAPTKMLCACFEAAIPSVGSFRITTVLFGAMDTSRILGTSIHLHTLVQNASMPTLISISN
ncbi:hypothetical protein CCMSSC00406_0009856 [Pleurotus cornucopiae]|uniref:Uncharacterized protein n=1 Tax=Pleurotus cornucopiae TaxID=5321 RepID=A0ACB7J5N7_PLECO|nr:hypothetical protein CCMSSC00406_0009856 [Pleurotus cornucopiae]